ncbi:MAG: hypothetical protein L3J35_10015 [Bacteroidales bacterium]|nr:hypothetical protein [Bacteroidales bacterium]
MKLEWEIIKRFSQNDTPCFSTEDVREEFINISSSYLNNALILLYEVKKMLEIMKKSC